jgi:hypothetical protein
VTPPICPPGWFCTFTQAPQVVVHPRVVHPPQPWWEGWGGVAMAAAALLVVLCVALVVINHWVKARQARHLDAQEREKRAHRERVAESFAVAVSEAKGNSEILKLVRDTQREVERL